MIGRMIESDQIKDSKKERNGKSLKRMFACVDIGIDRKTKQLEKILDEKIRNGTLSKHEPV